MVRAGEKIKYCRVGHLVGHIYFASSIETLNKEGQKCGHQLSERLEACQGILTIKEKNIMSPDQLWYYSSIAAQNDDSIDLTYYGCYPHGPPHHPVDLMWTLLKFQLQ